MKTIQINKVKVNIFEEEELKEKLGMIEKDINLIITYQRTFPELLQDDIEGFIIDARKLYNQLKLQQDFSHWIKNQIKNLDLEEGISYTFLKTNCTVTSPNASIEYYLTLDSLIDILKLGRAEFYKTKKYLIENDFISIQENKTILVNDRYCKKGKINKTKSIEVVRMFNDSIRELYEKATAKEHKKFHSIFGYGNNTPNQYEEFKEIRLKELNNHEDLEVAN